MNKLENELCEIKWFDYRALPVEGANLYFLREFAKACSDNQKLLGHSGYVNHFFKKLDLKQPEKWHSMKYIVKLRQFADLNFMKYSDFWQYAFEAFNKFGFKRFFVNVFLNKDILQYVKEENKKKRAALMAFADFKFYEASSYSGLPLQDDYQFYLVKCVKNIYGDNWRKHYAEWVKTGKASFTFYKKFKERIDKQ